MKKFIPVILILILAAAANSGLIVEKGQPAPEFSIFHLKGKRFNSADLKGKKALLINIFSITCEPCKEELPYMAKLYEKYKDDIEFVGIDITDPKKADVEDFAKASAIPWPICWDSISKTFYKKYLRGGFNMPTSIFVDKDGNIMEITGALKEDEMIKIIEGIIKK